MARIKMHIPKEKLPFYPPYEVKCRLQNGVLTLLINGFLEVVTIKSSDGVFVLRGFPHLSTNHGVNLFSAAFSLIGDLLVPSRFACN